MASPKHRENMSASRSNLRPEGIVVPWWLRWPREKLTLATLFACVFLWLPVLLVIGVF